MGIKIVGQVEKVNGRELSYTEFAQRYMEKNQPVVLTGLMEDWRACQDWVADNGQPNLQFFATHFGKSKVQVLFFHLWPLSYFLIVSFAVLVFISNLMTIKVEFLYPTYI